MSIIIVIFVSNCKIIMVRTFSLGTVKSILNEVDELTNNFISRHCVIIRQTIPYLLHVYFSQPIAFNTIRLYLIECGWAQITVNFVKKRIEAGDFVYIGSGVLTAIEDFSDDVKLCAITISDELLDMALSGGMPAILDGHVPYAIFKPDAVQQKYYLDLIDLIERNIAFAESNGLVTLQLVRALLWYVDSVWKPFEASNAEAISRNKKLFADFMALIVKHVDTYRTMEYYAGKLCLSPRYFSTIVKQVSGKSAKEWIDRTVVTKIKIMLKNSDKTLQEIADSMHFEDTARLCTFFKRHTSLSPIQFKKKDVSWAE